AARWGGQIWAYAASRRSRPPRGRPRAAALRQARHRYHRRGPMRAVFETLGVQDVVAKSMGTSNPYNMVRATFHALKNQLHPRVLADQRGVQPSTLQARRGMAVAAEE